ncbi:MAG: hypothetical protein EOO68_05505 [Moraxellaceae bacterium]|nr:MAG: hypothetical protein EOO68_05505 [Moraxellaceae bacterium]
MNLPKGFGAIDSSELLSFADSAAKQAANAPDLLSAERFHAAAGSAYIESTITRQHDQDTVDTALDCIDEAAYHLREAANSQFLRLEQGSSHPNKQAGWIRSELNCEFINVYKDITCNEVTDHTKREILEKLTYWKNYAEIASSMEENDIGGLKQEIFVLMKIWSSYLAQGESITFPSTLRGGDGTVNKRDTHDIIIATQNRPDNWVFSGFEVKSTAHGLTKKSLVRYNNPILSVDARGKIRIYDGIG